MVRFGVDWFAFPWVIISFVSCLKKATQFDWPPLMLLLRLLYALYVMLIYTN